MTKAGGVDLPGEVGGLVALDEVLMHGWDLARATGQPYRPRRRGRRGIADRHARGERSGGKGRTACRPGRRRTRDAPPFDRVLGLAGRDPVWSPADCDQGPAARPTERQLPRQQAGREACSAGVRWTLRRYSQPQQAQDL